MKDRECGECTACCYSLGVTSIPKDEFSPCPFLAGAKDPEGSCEAAKLIQLRTRAGGCVIYPSKPEVCSVYQCMWRDGTIEDEEARPDRLGVIFSAAQSKVLGPYVQLAEAIDGSVTQPVVQMMVKKIGEKFPVLQVKKEQRVLMAAPDEIFQKVIGILQQQQADFEIRT